MQTSTLEKVSSSTAWLEIFCFMISQLSISAFLQIRWLESYFSCICLSWCSLELFCSEIVELQFGKCRISLQRISYRLNDFSLLNAEHLTKYSVIFNFYTLSIDADTIFRDMVLDTGYFKAWKCSVILVAEFVLNIMPFSSSAFDKFLSQDVTNVTRNK